MNKLLFRMILNKEKNGKKTEKHTIKKSFIDLAVTWQLLGRYSADTTQKKAYKINCKLFLKQNKTQTFNFLYLAKVFLLSYCILC